MATKIEKTNTSRILSKISATGESISRMHDIYSLNISHHCPRKTFYTIFLNETKCKDRRFLKQLIDVGKNYEELACLTFIDKSDVLSFIKNNKKVKLPPAAMKVLTSLIEGDEFKEYEETEVMTDKMFAQFVKLKLIQTMYMQYIDAVKNQRRRQGLEEGLTLLVKECRKSKSPTGKKDKAGSKSVSQDSKKKDKGKGKGKEKAKEVEKGPTEDADYTTTVIDNEDNIVFEDNIFNCIWFYVFTGFYNTHVFKELSDYNFPISAVMSFRSFENIKTVSSDDYQFKIPSNDDSDDFDFRFQNELDAFWKNITKDLFDERLEFSENTILMKFQADDEVNEENSLDIFEKLLYAIRTIVDLKLNHLNYIRHLFIYKRQHEYKYIPVHCLQKYKEQLKRIPFECRNILYIFSGILKEVSFRIENNVLHSNFENVSSDSLLSSKEKARSKICVNVFDFKSFKKKRPDITPTKKSSIKTFLCPDNDTLATILNAYDKKIGRYMYDTGLTMLNSSNKIVHLLDSYENDYTDIGHRHDRDPTSKNCENDECFMHFLYLFLFATFNNDIIPPKVDEDDDLTEFLIIYNFRQIWESFQVKRPSRSNFSVIEDNFYEIPSTDFVYKESLHSGVLVQELMKADEEFSYCDTKFSPETNNLLIQFHDKLDQFGMNVKIYEVSVKTPVCVRDYCRYIINNEKHWIRKNSPPTYVRPTEKLEKCQGVSHVIAQSKLFEDYYYLLEIDENTETEQPKIDETTPTKSSENDDKKMSFGDMVSEIENMPCNKSLKEQCGKISENSKLVYDFGTKYFQLTGCTTTFHSHDGVKVIVDSTRFLGEPQKCRVKLSSKNNDLIIHSESKVCLNDNFTFHVNLEDGTLVLFIIQNTKPKIKVKKQIKVDSSLPDIDFRATVDTTTTNESIKEEVMKSETNIEQATVNVNNNYEAKVSCIGKKQFEKIVSKNLDQNNDSIQSDEQKEVDEILDSEYNLLKMLKNAVEEGTESLYKVSNEYQYVQQKFKDTKVPLYNIIQRFLCTDVNNKKIGEQIKKYGEDFQNIFQKAPNNILDFRITLPNGLYITTYPSVSDIGSLEVKQEYLVPPESKQSMSHEEFRLFSRQGFIVIKKIDATITILKTNGEIFEFESPIGTDDVPLKSCHCFTVDDYVKKLNKILKKQEDEYGFSRRQRVNSKRNTINDDVSQQLLAEFDVPYFRKNIIKFNGEKVTIQGNKISLKQKYITTEEKDFIAEQLFYDRNDGLRCLYERDGRMQVRFPEGTQISSIVEVSDQLHDGYVYISVYFKYEHPHYATVSYLSEGNFQVDLNNNVTLNGNQEHIDLNIDQEINVSTTKENILFNKSCCDCDGIFEAKLNIAPLCQYQWNPNEDFLHIRDSYFKEVWSDFVGNCRRNSDFAKKFKNEFGCDHTVKNCYKKLFIANKNYEGDMLWTNSMIQQRTAEHDKDTLASVDTYQYLKNKRITVFDFRKKFQHSFCDRFFNNDLLYGQLTLEQYKTHEDERQLFYSTYRQIFQMIDSNYVKDKMFDVQDFFQSQYGKAGECIRNIFKNVHKGTRFSKESEEIEIIEDEFPDVYSCQCAKTKIDIKTKIVHWQNEKAKYLNLIKNRTIPVYFKSQFCVQ